MTDVEVAQGVRISADAEAVAELIGRMAEGCADPWDRLTQLTWLKEVVEKHSAVAEEPVKADLMKGVDEHGPSWRGKKVNGVLFSLHTPDGWRYRTSKEWARARVALKTKESDMRKRYQQGETGDEVAAFKVKVAPVRVYLKGRTE